MADTNGEALTKKDHGFARTQLGLSVRRLLFALLAGISATSYVSAIAQEQCLFYIAGQTGGRYPTMQQACEADYYGYWKHFVNVDWWNVVHVGDYTITSCSPGMIIPEWLILRRWDGIEYYSAIYYERAPCDRYHGKPNLCENPKVGDRADFSNAALRGGGLSTSRVNPPVGNPIYPLTGSKTLRESTGQWGVAGQSLNLIYDSSRQVPVNNSGPAFNYASTASFGGLWTSNLHKSLVTQLSGAGMVRALQASRGGGVWISFAYDGMGHYLPDSDVNDRLEPDGINWRYIDAGQRAEELYDPFGRLLNVSYASGTTLTYTYSDASTPAPVAPGVGFLIAVTDQTGRKVQFEYELAAVGSQVRIKRIVDPAAQATLVSYDSNGNLIQLSWPDGKTRQYLYERSDIPWAVTGIVDETNTRLATYGYDATGRANDTQWAGGADHFSVSYSSPPSWNVEESVESSTQILWRDHYWQAPQGTTVTRPNGSTSSLGTVLVQGVPRLTSQSQPAGSGCAASTSTLTYDANGNKASEDDFNGKRVCYANNLSRNLETVRVEGLAGGAGGAACAGVTSAGASLPTGSRKVSTTWHPDWRFPVQQAEPGKLTSWIYHGQPDPFNGGAVASCAPAGAVLPSGKPIAVLCKQVEQATTDTDGHLGFIAALQSNVPTRTRSWAYNATGQVLTETNPRNQTTTYAYYTDTTADHTLGDLRSVTNAATQTTTFDKYDKNGQLLQSTDVNSVVTINTYDPRGRLLTASVAGQTTTYTYDPVGQLTRVTLPDTSWIGYEYDAAHRRTATLDNQGNRIEYALDSLGNVTAQSVKDPGGTLRRALGQVIDALGRVQQITGGV